MASPIASPDGAEPLEVLVGIEADLDLERLVAHVGVAFGVGGHGLGRVDPGRDVALERGFIPAEEPVERQARGLAEDVEAGHLEGGDGAGIGMDEGPDEPQDGVDGQRVLADEHVPDGLGRGDVRGLRLSGDGREGTGLADPDEAAVRADADEHVIGGTHLADGDPEGGDERQVERIDLDVLDGHLGRSGPASGRVGPGQGQAESAQARGQAAESEELQELFAGQAHDRSFQPFWMKSCWMRPSGVRYMRTFRTPVLNIQPGRRDLHAAAFADRFDDHCRRLAVGPQPGRGRAR